jgi:hypothetical protein
MDEYAQEFPDYDSPGPEYDEASASQVRQPARRGSKGAIDRRKQGAIGPSTMPIRKPGLPAAEPVHKSSRPNSSRLIPAILAQREP